MHKSGLLIILTDLFWYCMAREEKTSYTAFNKEYVKNLITTYSLASPICTLQGKTDRFRGKSDVI